MRAATATSAGEGFSCARVPISGTRVLNTGTWDSRGRYWLDLDHAEVAETLGVAVGTVKATTHQALARLRKVWPDDAVAEHERRLVAAARRVRRRPMLAAAAAAVVIAATVPASVVTQHDPRPPADPGVGAGQDPAPDGPWLTVTENPVSLGEFDDAGRHWVALAFIERQPDGHRGWAHRVCVMGVPPGRPANDPDRHPDSTGCTSPPAGERKVETRTVLRGRQLGGGPLPGLLLFVAAPAVAELEARAADGTPVAAVEVLRNEDLALFSADFGGSVEGFGYTARDAAGNVVETAIS